MRKRTGYTLVAVSLLLCAFAAVLYLRQKAPPEVARLLPEADGIVYLNLKPIRAATRFDRNPVKPSISYQQFIDATGIVAERDLDAAALAMHSLLDTSGPNGAVAFSEVLQGRFDSGRLGGYLARLSTDRETYAGHVVYSIPSEGRTLRVVVLGYDLVAGSNMPTAEQIHSILDRQRMAASPFAGSSLLSARYGDVPAFSSAWAIGKIGLPFAENGKITLCGLGLPLSPEAPFVASLGVSPLHPGAVAVRVDQLAGSEAAAVRSVEALNGLLSLFRSLQMAQGASGSRQFTDTISITQNKDRTTLRETIPMETLRQFGKQ